MTPIRGLTFLDKVNALLLLHLGLVQFLDQSVDETTAGSTDCVLLTHHHSTQRNRINLATQFFIVARHNDSSHHGVTAMKFNIMRVVPVDSLLLLQSYRYS